MIGGLITAARFGYAAVTGVDALVDSLAQYSVKMALKSRKVDDDAGDAMVAAMRADAPQLTGNLVNGITTRREGGVTVVEASALRTSGGVEWDYAVFVEKGHGRAAAEPFFYDDAEQVLEARGDSLDDAMAAAAAESGF